MIINAKKFNKTLACKIQQCCKKKYPCHTKWGIFQRYKTGSMFENEIHYISRLKKKNHKLHQLLHKRHLTHINGKNYQKTRDRVGLPILDKEHLQKFYSLYHS